jgi:two-component system sensor histidine kinase SenX3
MGTTLAIVALAVVVIGLAIGGIHLRRVNERLRSRADRAEVALAEVAREGERDRRVSGMVVGAMRDGLLLVDPGGDVAFANEALATHLGATAASLGSLLPLALRNAIVEARRNGEPRSVVLETGPPSRWLRGSITPAGDGHTLVVVQDVTEQRRLEAVRRDFVENASHELKTPAATIQATAETLRGAVDDDPEAVAGFAARLEREALRLSRLVADLLDLSRLESGSATDDVVSLAAIIEEECRRLQPAADEAGVTLELRTEPSQPVRGSSRDLSLLVRNLVDNAIRYSADGAKVLVEVSSESGEAVIRVTDTGIGIPSRDLSRIFERFYRVDRARSRETGGTGLGLAIVKHVVENHGGRTSVESELGRGTTFQVALPADGSVSDMV